MLNLVAYCNSSDSETEENEETDGKVTVANTSLSIEPAKVSLRRYSRSSELFTNLPQPMSLVSNTVHEEQDDVLRKKEQATEKPRKVKQPIKISVLSVDAHDSEDDDDDSPPDLKKTKLNTKSSGLFALLPPPKVTPITSTSFIPNVLKKKNNIKPVKVLPPSRTKPVEEKKPLVKDSDDEDDDIVIPDTYDDEMWQKVCGKPSVPVKSKVADVTHEVVQDPAFIVEAAPEVEKPYDGLDNKAFKELVGSRKRLKGNIELIDIHEDEIRPDREEWLKSLTDPSFEQQSSVKDSVNNTCKSKNHITSLAQKAVANDKELQMRWSESRHNRRQTQAKYGF